MRCALLSAVGLVVLMAASVSAAPSVTGDLTLYYGFDSVSGTTITDGSGNGYDGTIVGSITQTTGPSGNGNAALFWHEGEDEAGVDWNYINLPVGAIKSGGDIPTSGFTLAAWYKVPFSTQTQGLFSAKASDSTWLCHSEIRGKVATATDDSYYRYVLRAYSAQDIGSVAAGRYDTTEDPEWDIWTHIAMTYDRASQVMKVYENGQVIGQTTTLDYDIAADWDLGAVIGNRVGPLASDLRQILGSLDEIYIFSRAITDEEIQTLATIDVVGGDANLDGSVDGVDAAMLAENWLTSSNATWAMGDFNRDGMVNDEDAAIMAANWSAGSSASASVPEPGTFIMLATGLAGLLAYVLRKRK